MQQEIVWGRAPSPVQAERSSAVAGGHNKSGLIRALLVLTLLAFLLAAASRTFANEPEPSAAQPSAQSAQPTSAEPARKEDQQAASERKSIGGQLAEETREASGAEEEEHADLKHAAPIRWLARKTGLSVHGAHLLLISLNFAIIAVIVFWAVRKFVPGMLRSRGASIQQALEEARVASQDANRRLAEIENRLRQLDVEIGHMQATAEKEGDAEDVRIQQAAEEDIRKVVVAAEQEITAAAKQARRELTTHTADLALALARQQINVDSNTDQVLVRTFAAKLTSPASRREDDGGKEGR